MRFSSCNNIGQVEQTPLDRSETVSYTHLDVYKRQNLSCHILTLSVISYNLLVTAVSSYGTCLPLWPTLRYRYEFQYQPPICDLRVILDKTCVIITRRRCLLSEVHTTSVTCNRPATFCSLSLLLAKIIIKLIPHFRLCC